MIYRKGELSPASIDRDWPHQVALPANAQKLGQYAGRQIGGEAPTPCWQLVRGAKSGSRPAVRADRSKPAFRYWRAVISRVRTPSSSTYHSPMIILIAGNVS
jgi:hypothetical protein